MSRRVGIRFGFEVADGVTDEMIHTIASNAYVQVSEPVVGYADDLAMNELTIKVGHVTTEIIIEEVP